MAFTLDYNTLDELGLGQLPPEEKKAMLTHILETLEMRVGTNLASRMSDEQLSDFERLMPLETDSAEIAKNKEKSALSWLETNFPNYKEVVKSELDSLKQEIQASSAQILAASQQAQSNQVGSPLPPQPDNTQQF
ncbi:MAG TPA: DUF5663 domain-containing protein [Patescibacteria group bacterium]|jgi:hypothetical protein|nr:DUF5663 domain-containing protein [Patescibacteria group bacterium]